MTDVIQKRRNALVRNRGRPAMVASGAALISLSCGSPGHPPQEDISRLFDANHTRHRPAPSRPGRDRVLSIFHGVPMRPTPESIRETYAISGLCHLFEATLHPCLEEGFPRHQLHYLPSPVVLENHGRKVILPDPQLGCLFSLRRFGPLNLPPEELAALERKPLFESFLLAMPVGDACVVMPMRTRFMQASEHLFLDFMEQCERVLLVAISHRRRIHGQVIVRHQPVALLDLTGKMRWLHPAAHRFGLIKQAFPASQRHRLLDPWDPDFIDWAELREASEDELPQWYHEAREALRDQGKEDPVTDALLGFQAGSLLAAAAGKEALERLQSTAKAFLTDFEQFFGQGGLLPAPGVLDLA